MTASVGGPHAELGALPLRHSNKDASLHGSKWKTVDHIPFDACPVFPSLRFN